MLFWAGGPKVSSGHTQMNKTFHIFFTFTLCERPFALAPQMSYAVILGAWLAMIPQLMPQQKTE